ncbi:hypothetical protein HAX54_029516 [Datura stramonium]|uniref:Uncharacterized protein n=1 Tax=Datura stramonium TaxID=4076 RepID=A0ABS8SAA7_DATST|nr:hypothetical protein [Datura stramonium]
MDTQLHQLRGGSSASKIAILLADLEETQFVVLEIQILVQAPATDKGKAPALWTPPTEVELSTIEVEDLRRAIRIPLLYTRGYALDVEGRTFVSQ